MKKSLKIAEDLWLPMEAVTERLGFLGRTGTGKSYAAQKLAEQMLGSGVQVVVLDPVGIWWGLRLAADGKSAGIAIPVFGGLHGDIPLEPTAGAMIADTIVERRISVVLDVSQFESDADKARFATDFGNRFFFRKKAAPSAVHLFLEECQEFVPQNPMREEARMLHAFTRVVKIGRNFGIGISMISQRPQEVNKKVLNLTEILFVFQLTGPQERKTVEGWIAEKGIDEDIAGDLPRLERGKPHIWSPALLKESRVIAISEKWTYDASSTPKVGAARVAARDLAPIDLEQLRKAMAATIERAKADDPKELRKKIAELQRELAAKPATPAPVPAPLISEVDRKWFSHSLNEIRLRLTATRDSHRRAVESYESLQKDLQTFNNGIDHIVAKISTARLSVAAIYAKQPIASINSASIYKSLSKADASSDIRPGEQKMLTAIAQHPEGVTREQLTVLTGYKKSSRDVYLYRLRSAELTDILGDRISVTHKGVAVLGNNFEPLPVGQELREYWMRRLPDGERRLFELIVNAYPSAIDRAALDHAGFKKSSRDVYLARLAARQLIKKTGPGAVIASDKLF